jgi:ankyrin repeat protein
VSSDSPSLDNTTWWAAVEAGDIDGIRALLHAGADPDLQDVAGETALHRVLGAELEPGEAPEPLNVEIAGILLDAGADINGRSGEGLTPLMLAVDSGELEDRMALLLSRGADPDVRDADGRTALMRGVEWMDIRTLRCLLSSGADPNAADLNGETAIHIAVLKSARQETGVRELSDDNTRERLGIPADQPLIPMILKRADELLEIVQLLVDYGARPDICDHACQTPLDCARAMDAVRVVDVLTAARKAGEQPG